MMTNAFRAAVTEYGPDPHDQTAAGLLQSIWTRVQGARTHPYAPAQKDPSTTFNGTVTDGGQHFRGVQLGGGVPYRNGNSATVDSGLIEGPLGDPARRIFAQRLARRSSLGGM